MNDNAFQIIKELGLPIPKTYSIENISNLSKNKKYYLRYFKSSGKSNKLVKGFEILQNKHTIIRELENQELAYIEATYKSIAGGATLVKKDFSYSEIVTGHVVSLLRRGLCSTRVFLFSNGKIEILRSTQKFRARQSKVYKWEIAEQITNDLLNKIIKKLDCLKKISHNGLLLEWMFTTEGMIFCDAKDRGFDDFGKNIIKYEDLSSSLIYEFQKNIIVDQFDIDFDKTINENDILVCYNGAILSHFITRNWLRTSKILLGGNIDFRN